MRGEALIFNFSSPPLLSSLVGREGQMGENAYSKMVGKGTRLKGEGIRLGVGVKGGIVLWLSCLVLSCDCLVLPCRVL